MLYSRDTTPIHMRKTIPLFHAPFASGPTIMPPYLGTSSPTPLASWTHTTLPVPADQRA